MQDDLDGILAQGLASYAGREPLAGIEERILTRISLARRPRWRMTRWWAAGSAAALAGLAVGVMVLPHQQEQPQPRHMAAVAAVQPGAEINVPKVLVPQPGHVRTRAIRTPAAFPTRSPMTAEERRLVALVDQHPEALESLRRQSGPLKIEPLIIQPLETGGGQ